MCPLSHVHVHVYQCCPQPAVVTPLHDPTLPNSLVMPRPTPQHQVLAVLYHHIVSVHVVSVHVVSVHVVSVHVHVVSVHVVSVHVVSVHVVSVRINRCCIPMLCDYSWSITVVVCR